MPKPRFLMRESWRLEYDKCNNLILVGKDRYRGSLVYAQVLWQSGFEKRGRLWLDFYTADGIRYRVPLCEK